LRISDCGFKGGSRPHPQRGRRGRRAGTMAGKPWTLDPPSPEASAGKLGTLDCGYAAGGIPRGRDRQQDGVAGNASPRNCAPLWIDSVPGSGTLPSGKALERRQLWIDSVPGSGTIGEGIARGPGEWRVGMAFSAEEELLQGTGLKSVPRVVNRPVAVDLFAGAGGLSEGCRDLRLQPLPMEIEVPIPGPEQRHIQVGLCCDCTPVQERLGKTAGCCFRRPAVPRVLAGEHANPKHGESCEQPGRAFGPSRPSLSAAANSPRECCGC